MNFVTSLQVRELRSATPPAAVLDVRIPEEFSASRIAGALNACVFQPTFLDDVRRLLPDASRHVIVCGGGLSSLESTEAVQRLVKAGYTAVHNFPGGIEEWKRDGLPTLGEGPKSLSPLDGAVPLDMAETRIEWTGRNLLGKHSGSVSAKSGFLLFRDGWLSGGELAIDMTSILCTDVADPAWHAKLLDHLRSSDFFDVEAHPEARVVVKQTTPMPGGRPGIPNVRMLCDLTLRGVTKELACAAIAGRTPEGRPAAQIMLVFDRTEWGSSYGSSRFFQNLGRHLVNDFVEVQVRLVT